MDMAKLRATDPVFADQLSQNFSYREVTGGTLAFVRSKALQSAEIAKFEELVALGELKQMWLAAAIKVPGQCQNVLAGNFRSLPLLLGKDELKRERELLRRLLDAKLLGHDSKRTGGNFSLPGWAVEKMLKQSGLSIDELTAALKDPEHPKRCEVDLAMLRVILAEPGRVSPEVLRAL
jgi:hypothetical protein